MSLILSLDMYLRPTVSVSLKISDGHRYSSPVTLQARALVTLQLEQLKTAGLFRRSRDHVQYTRAVRQQQTGRSDIEQSDALLGQTVQQLDHVERPSEN